jgi:uncharacterized protein (TIGR02996 family)
MIERERQLLDAIVANRDDRDVYRVYGDYLESRGDPRGALIAMQLRADEADGEDSLFLAIRAHLSRYSLLPMTDPWAAQFRWKWGFIVGAELDSPDADQLAMVLAHPSCVALQSLRLELEAKDLAAVLARLTQSIPTIEKLVVIYKGSLDLEYIDHVDPGLWTRLPRLDRLELEGPVIPPLLPHFQSIRSNLRELVLCGAPFENDAMWDLPLVTELTWSELHIEALAPLWFCALPSLRRLSLDGTFDRDGLFRNEGFLARGARLEELKVTRRSEGNDTRGVETFHASGDQLRNLRNAGFGRPRSTTVITE